MYTTVKGLFAADAANVANDCKLADWNRNKQETCELYAQR